jgi:predicted PurR-regulated permease PerM
MMQPSQPFRPMREVLSIIAISLSWVALLYVAYRARVLILTLWIGLGFGVLLTPVMNLFQKRFRVPRALSAVVSVLLILGAVAGITYGLGTLVSEQGQSLFQRAPQLVERISNQAESLTARHPWISEQLRRFNFAQATRTFLSRIVDGLQASFSSLIGGVLIMTIGIFTALNSGQYLNSALSIFPAYRRPRIREVLQASALSLRRWFRSQLLVMAMSGIATTLALWALGIDYWLLLGVLTGLFGFIPNVGAILTGFFTGLVTLASQPDKFVWVVVIYIAIQQLEGNVVTPLIMRGGVQLPEVHTLIFMMMMGSLFGLLGVFAAPPLLAVMRTIYLMTYGHMMDLRLSPPEAAPPSPRPSGKKAA